MKEVLKEISAAIVMRKYTLAEILKILKDKLCLYIYDNEPNQLYVAGNTEDITDKEEELLKLWLSCG